jgi:hypothetical protein
MKGVIKINLKYEPPPIFTADWHLGHHGIIKFDTSPRTPMFDDIRVHDKFILDRYKASITSP